MVQIRDSFKTMAEAREAITRFLLNAGQSYKVYKGDSKRYILICKDKDCGFKIRASYLKKHEAAVITILKPHTCMRTRTQVQSHICQTVTERQLSTIRKLH